jgi:hypothetical protein
MPAKTDQTTVAPLPGSLGTTGTQPGYGAYGTVPTVPDPLTSQQAALYGNTNILNQLLGLSQGMGAASAAGAQEQLISNLPGYQGMTAQASQNILSDLQGKIPQDVMAVLNQAAAERGIGFDPTSPATNAAAMRAMGLTSLGLQQQGQQELTSAIARTPIGPQFNPATMAVTPAEEQQWQYLANELAAAPDPTLAAMQNQQSLMDALKLAMSLGGGGGAAATGAPAPLTSTGAAGGFPGDVLNPPVQYGTLPGGAAGAAGAFGYPLATQTAAPTTATGLGRAPTLAPSVTYTGAPGEAAPTDTAAAGGDIVSWLTGQAPDTITGATADNTGGAGYVNWLGDWLTQQMGGAPSLDLLNFPTSTGTDITGATTEPSFTDEDLMYYFGGGAGDTGQLYGPDYFTGDYPMEDLFP